ncbi:MAG: hypothetical protein ACKPCM_05065, partial [Pseudanabaena sp.]
MGLTEDLSADMTQSSPTRIPSIDTHATIDVIAESEFLPAKHSKSYPVSSFQASPTPSSALVANTGGNFASVLAPLTPEKFSQVV